MPTDSDMKTISADMGGSRVKLAMVENGAIVENEIFPVSDDGFVATLAELERRISVLRTRHPGEWDGIGIALPGIIDEERCRVLSCNDKHAGVENVDIFAWAREKLSLPCRMINDARAALLGELNFGCAKGEQNAVMMILGTEMLGACPHWQSARSGRDKRGHSRNGLDARCPSASSVLLDLHETKWYDTIWHHENQARGQQPF